MFGSKKLRKIFAWILALICTFSYGLDFSLVANANGLPAGQVYMIKNSYTPDAYLYEKDGEVLYGKPVTIGDLSYYWVIEPDAGGSGNSRIRNAATGHYMNYTDQLDFNDPVQCLDIGSAVNSLFTVNSIVDNGVTMQNIIASTNASLIVHTEQALGHAQCSNWAQASWGTAKWIFEKPDDFVFRIKNSYTADAYLYESSGQVLYGKPDSISDLSFYWVVEPNADDLGNVRIKNVLTGHYMNYVDQADYNDPIQCVDIGDAIKDLFALNGIDDNGTVKQNITASTNSNLIVHIQQDLGHAQCSNWAQASWGTAQWIFEKPESNKFVIKNSFVNDAYLHEQDGQVLYGAIGDTSDASFQWVIEPDPDGLGKTRIMNVSTGHYMNYVDQADYNDPMTCVDIGSVTFGLFNLSSTVDGEAVKQNIIASTNPSLVVHIQQELGHAQCSNWAQASWGTAQWLFVNPAELVQPEEPPEEPASVTGLVFKIKNSYRADTYLYEKDGEVLYGKPNSVFDLSYYWVIESNADGSGHSRIRNAATGHYMNYTDQADYNEAVDCVDISDATKALFTINDIAEGDANLHNIIASTNPSLVVHVQQEMGHAQCSNWAQASWGTAKWIFEDAGDKTPQGIAFKIQNSYTVTDDSKPVFLYEDNGAVSYGPLNDLSDTSFYWFLNIDDNGKYIIRNWKTGHYIVYQNQQDNNSQLECLDYSAFDTSGTDAVLFAINNINDNGTVKHNMESAVNPAIRVHTENFAFPVCSNWAQNSFGTAQWLFIDPVTVAPTEVLTPNGHIRIKNDWSGQYLYEDNGKVKYGQPASNNPLSHWDIVDQDGHSMVKNVGTGHYFSYKNQTDYNEPIECLELSSAAYPLFDITTVNDNGVEKKTIGASTNSNLVVHVEQQTGYAQCSNWAQASWGSAKWIFEPASDDVVGGPVKEEIPIDQDPAAALNDGDIIRLKNSWREMYLYQADDGKVAYGNVAASDLGSQWIVEEAGDNIRLKNRETGKYMSVENGLGYAECLDANSNTPLNQWEVVTAPNTVSGMKTIRSAGWSDNPASGEDSYYLHTEGDKGYAEYGPIPATWGSPQWIITRVSSDDSSTGYLRIKNKATGYYLYEDNGKVAFGTGSEIAADDASSHWVVERTLRYTYIKNRATGDYVNIEGMAALTDPLTCKTSNNTLNAVWKVTPTGDGSFTMESMNKDGWYINNSCAITTTFAQCSPSGAQAGASQWVFEEAPLQIGNTLPADFTLIKSRSGDQYLYENRNGAVLYGPKANDDTSYQWKIQQDGDNYTIMNEFTGHYLSNQNAKPFLESVAGSASEAAHWTIDAAPVSNYSIIANAASPARFVNTNAGLGFAQASVLSNEKTAAQWSFETPAGNAQDPVFATDDTDTTTPVISDNEFVAIRNKATGKYVNDNQGAVGFAEDYSSESSQWILEDYNGYRIIKNRQTGDYLMITAADGDLQTASANDELNAQWIISDFLGYEKIESVAFNPKYLYANVGTIDCKVADNASDMFWAFEPIAADTRYEAEKAFISGNVAADGNSVTGFYAPGDKVVFTVNAAHSGNYTIDLAYTNPASSDVKMDLYVNGVKTADTALAQTSKDQWGTSSYTATLHAGINTISYQYAQNPYNRLAIDSLTVKNSTGTAYKGATLPYVTYEAEDAAFSGTLIGPSVNYYTFASEASGREAVRLEDSSDYVEFELARDANALVIRYVLPDAAQGGGTAQTVGLYADGSKVQDIDLSSKHSWVYGSYPWTNNPQDGKGHRYYDETRIKLGSTLPAGTVVKIQKNNAAEYCIIDLIDMENVEPAYVMPDNFLSITAFGAVANDGTDDTPAMNACIAAAKAQGKGVWLPAGTFDFKNGSRGVEGIDDTRIIVPDGVVIKGAGMWYTTLSGPFAGFMVKGSDTGFYDFSIEGTEVTRDDAHGTTGLESDYNTSGMHDMTIQNVWLNHVKTGIWLNGMNNAHIAGVRVRNTYADGIHLSKGTSNSIVEQSQVRNSGDDGIAMWSQVSADKNNTVRLNTVQLPWLANNIAVYGGENNRIQDNIIKDTVAFGGGINVSSNYSPIPFAGSVIVERNDLIRAGGHEYNFNIDYGAIRIDTTDNINADVVFSNNNIYDSSYQGVSIHGPNTIVNLVFENNVIDGTGTWGANAVNGSKGNASLFNLIIRNAGVENFYNSTPGGSNGFNFMTQNDWDTYDSNAPEWPQNSALQVSGMTRTTASLSWNAATSENDLFEYIVIWQGQVKHVSGNVTNLQATGLTPGTPYAFSVYAKDIYGNISSLLGASGKTMEASTGGNTPSAPPIAGTVQATVTGGTASASVGADVIARLVGEANANNTTGSRATVEIKISAASAADAVQLEIPGKALGSVAQAQAEFRMTSDIGSMTFDADAVASIAGSVGSENIRINMSLEDASELTPAMRNAVGDRPVYDFSVVAGNRQISSFGGGVARISVPYSLQPGENPNSVVVYYVDDRGNLTSVRGAYDASADMVRFTTPHFSKFTIGYKAVSFNDVKEGSWFHNAVAFTAARNITSGTGGNNFGPALPTTRAQFIVMLFKAYGIEPAAKGANNFVDAGNTYYTCYLAKAKELGISQGVGGNRFAPNAWITRQEMFTMMYNTLKAIGELPQAKEAVSLSNFTDAKQIAPWAVDAMNLLVSCEVIHGSGGKLSPNSTATRAEVVQTVFNLLAGN